MVVAREPRAGQVLGPRLNPLHRTPQLQRADNRAHVAGIDGDLVAEAAAEIWRHDVNLVFGNAGDERQRGAVDMRRLRRHVELQASHRVELGNAAARFERRGMAALEPDTLAHPLLARAERARRPVLVADLPVVDLVGLLLAVVAKDHLVLLRGEGIGHHRQRVVVDLDGLGAIHGRATRLRENGCDFLILEEHLADREHHLLVEAMERREPAEPRGLEIFSGDHRLHARDLHGLARIDRLDPRMRVRAAHQRQEKHAGTRDVVDVVALALQEARILLALHPDTHRLTGFGLDAHDKCSAIRVTRQAASACAACCTALTMFWYPVQRQRLPARPSRMSASLGFGVFFRRM